MLENGSFKQNLDNALKNTSAFAFFSRNNYKKAILQQIGALNIYREMMQEKPLAKKNTSDSFGDWFLRLISKLLDAGNCGNNNNNGFHI